MSTVERSQLVALQRRDLEKISNIERKIDNLENELQNLQQKVRNRQREIAKLEALNEF